MQAGSFPADPLVQPIIYYKNKAFLEILKYILSFIPNMYFSCLEIRTNKNMKHCKRQNGLNNQKLLTPQIRIHWKGKIETFLSLVRLILRIRVGIFLHKVTDCIMISHVDVRVLCLIFKLPVDKYLTARIRLYTSILQLLLSTA